ncbi:MAG: DUF1826 domain-containing protein [Pseudomonadota bacterium]
MTLHQRVTAETAIATTGTPEGLSAIRRPECAAALWYREPLASFQTWIDTVEPELLPRTRTVLRPDSVRQATRHICELCSTPDCSERAMLIDDIAAMADIFEGLMDAPYVLLRLDVVTSNMCRKFHIDAVTARLICTYRGTGTQYGFSRDGTDPHQVFTAPTGVPVLFRGTDWPQNPNSHLRHRSPPIEGTGETRLVLVLDPVTEPDEHMDQTHFH